MSTIGNNTSGKYSHLRDCFFSDSEKEYFQKLMENPKDEMIHYRLCNEQAKVLYKKAVALIQGVEQGEYAQSEMDEVEWKIVHYLAAIEDLQKVLMKELTKDDEGYSLSL